VTLLDEVLEAHGGLERWRNARRISARVRTGGALTRMRAPGNKFADYRIEVDVHEPRAVADPFPRAGERGVFEGGGVRIETVDAEVLESRADPRPRFFGTPGLRRNLRWDVLDSMYFCGYAMWNYLTTPLLFTREGVETAEGEPRRAGAETWRRLDVTFPPGLDTHSPEQSFYFDERGMLRRLEYVAEVIGGWAHGVHMCADHVEAGGLRFPTRRWVRPYGPGGRPLPFPTIISLQLDTIEVR
jgi:hypothetical protein